ncbi:acyl carrier protein [Fodinicola feengrottensis]|uniref:Carrier domain-containing protein n=1 Tax=Fodinicola feengrottensis TaxID=435914 RepID=A0ABN2I918_9ACTN|nr:acyl carrier protein [Fodinicola feengrottensis]
MSEFTADELARIMRQYAGVTDPPPLDGEQRDTDFAELGCDSLGLIEVKARIETEYHVTIPENGLSTPAELMDYVNEQQKAKR